MPNWIANKLTGVTEKELKPYMSKENDSTEYLDFNKIIPMPEELNIESSSTTSQGLEMLMTKTFTEKDLGNLSDIDKKRLILGCKAFSNLIKYGDVDWYYWHINHWGTKWNCTDYAFDGDSCTFFTAWNSPLPIIQKLSEILQTKITVAYADENCGYNTGRYEFDCGQCVEEYCPSGGSKEAFELYNEAWCNDYPIKQDKDGNWYIDWEE